MKMLLGNEWVDRKEKIEVRDPYHDRFIDTVPCATCEDVQLAFEHAQRGAETARRMTVYQRTEILHTVAGMVRDRAEEFAQLIAREGSKTIREARYEVARCVNTLRISGEEAKRIVGETIPFDSFPGGENRRGFYYRFPVGIVVAITPFNDPLNLVAHKVGPALAAGNSVVLKPASLTPLSGLKLAEALLEAGLPAGLLQVITGRGSEIGGSLVQDERVRMISVTGGIATGERVARLAGVKKLSMELGSNSPVIVWEDADLDQAVEACLSGAFWAAGQNCLGVQRLYLHTSLCDRFRQLFLERAGQYRVGDKLKDETDMGPMISETEAKRVESWIEEADQLGATVLTGGRRDGALLEPTVLEGVPEGARIHKEEVFGPTVNLYPVSDLNEAIHQANSLPFGLHAAIFTRSVEVAFKAAYELDCGGVMINDSTDYRLDSMPFGGVRSSGLGREGVRFTLQEMTESKVVCFNLAEPRAPVG